MNEQSPPPSSEADTEAASPTSTELPPTDAGVGTTSDRAGEAAATSVSATADATESKADVESILLAMITASPGLADAAAKAANMRGERKLAAQILDTEKSALAAEATARQEENERRESRTERRELRRHNLDISSQALTDRVTRIEAYIRAFLAVTLVLGTLTLVFYGLIDGLEPDLLVQYLAPISGLAGLVVGYFFGQTSGGRPGPATDAQTSSSRPVGHLLDIEPAGTNGSQG